MIRDTAWRKSAATRLQFARMQRTGRAWRLQNLRVKVYAPAENSTYLHVPVRAVRRAAGALIPKQTFPAERTAAAVARARFRLIGYFDIYCHGRKLARENVALPLVVSDGHAELRAILTFTASPSHHLCSIHTYNTVHARGGA